MSLKWGRCLPFKIMRLFFGGFFRNQGRLWCFRRAQTSHGNSAWTLLFAVKSGEPVAGVKARIFSLWRQHKGTAAEKSLCARSIFFDICSKVQGSRAESAQRTSFEGDWQASVGPLALWGTLQCLKVGGVRQAPQAFLFSRHRGRAQWITQPGKRGIMVGSILQRRIQQAEQSKA